MDFIMPVWLNCKCWLLCLLCLLAGMAAAEESGKFEIMQAKTKLQDNLYQLDATIRYRLSGEAIEALINGVPLTLVLTITVDRERGYWWDERIASIKQRYQLKYHTLSGQYLLTYLNTGIQDSFSTLNSALMAMGNLANFPLLDKHLVKPGESYVVDLHTYLDIEALPAPLRPVAYFSSEWRLASQHYPCPLDPS
jgi:hypothetical protein